MMNHTILTWLRDNFLLVGIFLSTALIVFLESYFVNTHLEVDAAFYLQEAQALCDGYGFHMRVNAGDPSAYFSIWPIGYPAVIAAVALLTGTDVYLASRIVSVVVLSLICTLFYVRFKRNAWVYALSIVSLGLLQLFWAVRSEQLFIFGLIWMACKGVDVVKDQQGKVRHYIALTGLGIGLFLVRYVGALSVGVLMLMAAYYLYGGLVKKHTVALRKALYLGVGAVIIAVVAGGYLYVNQQMTGYPTGMPRIPVKDSILRLLADLAIGHVRDIQDTFATFFMPSHGIAILAIVTITLGGGWFLFRHRKNTDYLYAYAFVTVGFIYYGAIVVMRFSAEMAGFSSRLLVPASTLFLLSALHIIQVKWQSVITALNKGRTKYALLALVAFPLLLQVLPPPIYVDRTTHRTRVGNYPNFRKQIISDLQHVPPHSLVITDFHCKEIHANFLRTDLIVISPKGYNGVDLVPDIQHHLEICQHVFVYTDWNIIGDSDNKDFFLQYRPTDPHQRVVQIK